MKYPSVALCSWKLLILTLITALPSLLPYPHYCLTLITTLPSLLQNVAALNPLSPEVISRQATINIGELFLCTPLTPTSIPLTLPPVRYYWARGSRQVHCGQSYLRSSGRVTIIAQE